MTLDGRPERLWIERPADPAPGRLGAESVARVRKIEPSLRTAFLDLGDGVEAVAPLTPGVAEGQALRVQVTAEARRGKAAVVRGLGPTPEGPVPRLLQPGPTLEARLAAAAGEPAVTGREARELADEAEDLALAVEHPLPGGGSLAIETTRALIAVDVDLGAATGDAGRAIRRANLAAVESVARLLRLKGLGGPVVVDLAGAGRDGEALLAAARAAFAPDQPGVVFGPLSRLGLLQLARPWRETPIEHRLLATDGRATPETIAIRLLRALERSGHDDRGGRFEALCSPVVAAFAAPLVVQLGPRFTIRADPGRGPENTDIRRL